MNVNLTPHLEKLVRDKVASGRYNNQSEVVREGLRLLLERDEQRDAALSHWKASLEKGLGDADQGRVLDGPTVFRELRAELESRKNT